MTSRVLSASWKPAVNTILNSSVILPSSEMCLLAPQKEVLLKTFALRVLLTFAFEFYYNQYCAHCIIQCVKESQVIHQFSLKKFLKSKRMLWLQYSSL